MAALTFAASSGVTSFTPWACAACCDTCFKSASSVAALAMNAQPSTMSPQAMCLVMPSPPRWPLDAAAAPPVTGADWRAGTPRGGSGAAGPRGARPARRGRDVGFALAELDVLRAVAVDLPDLDLQSVVVETPDAVDSHPLARAWVENDQAQLPRSARNQVRSERVAGDRRGRDAQVLRAGG